MTVMSHLFFPDDITGYQYFHFEVVDLLKSKCLLLFLVIVMISSEILK